MEQGLPSAASLKDTNCCLDVPAQLPSTQEPAKPTAKERAPSGPLLTRIFGLQLHTFCSTSLALFWLTL